MKDIPIIINGLNVNEAQARIKELEGLVGKMGKALNGSSVFLIRIKKDLLHPDSIKFGAGVLLHIIDEIINHPQVKTILEEPPCTCQSPSVYDPFCPLHGTQELP